MLIITLCAGILICYGIPTAGTFFLAHRKKGIWKAFFSGALAFIVSQLLIRIPILQLLVPRYAWYGALQLYPWLYGLFLGLTAGLAEETARLAAIRLFLKEQTGKEYGLAFGLGHGGIEAMLLVGPVFFSGLALTLTGREALFPATPAAILTSGAERLSALAFHLGASLLVMHGVREKKIVRFLAAAILLHTLLDAAIVILPAVFGTGTLGLELYAAAAGALTLAAGLLFCHKKGGTP